LSLKSPSFVDGFHFREDKKQSAGMQGQGI
jgi:hypothetical protein